MPRKRLKGKIKSLSGSKTVRVEVERVFHHPRYRRKLRAMKKYLAHFEGEVSVGQEVTIEESRPISKRKCWRVVEIEGKPIGEMQKAKSPGLAEAKPKAGKKQSRRVTSRDPLAKRSKSKAKKVSSKSRGGAKK